jgi:hypothetical protein
MNTTTIENAPARTSFTRLCATTFVKGLVKEAKRVKYTVNVLRDNDFGNGPIWGYEVFDPENGDALVFKSICVRPNMWGTTFSKVYWVEPTV